MVNSYEVIKIVRACDKKPVYLVERDQDMFIAKPFSPVEPMLTDLNHKSVARCYGLGRLTRHGKKIGDDFAISEYVPGKPLVRTENNLPIDMVTMYAHNILEGLIYLDKNGRAHGDISGGNVIVGTDHGAKLVDTSSSIFFGNSREKSTYECTPAFAAPEVLLMHRIIREKSEVYSTGVLLHDMLHVDGFANQRGITQKLSPLAKSKDLDYLSKTYEKAMATDLSSPQQVTPEFGFLNSYSAKLLERCAGHPRLRSILEAMLELQPNNRPNLAEAESEFAHIDKTLLLAN